MSIYKRKRKGKRDGSYTAEFRHHNRLYRRGGFPDRDTASFWLNSEQLKLKRGEVGYIKPMGRAQILPLVKEFCDYLAGRGRDEEYVYIADTRLHRLAGECGWKTISDVTAASLESWKGRPSYWANRPEKPISNRTKNQYIDIAREFGKWLHKPAAKLPCNPLADVEALRAKHNDEYRRAVTIDELNTLLATCGAEHRAYYIFRIYAPMRGKTIGGLTWRMMRLDASPPFAQTPAEINKGRRVQKHVIRLDVAQELRKLRKATKAKVDDLVFPDAPTLDDLKADLVAAGIPFDDGKGNQRFDFHSLRGTLVELGKNAGLTEMQVSELLGHKDIRTTMKYYRKNSAPKDLGAAMERLPVIGKVRMA